MLHVPLRTLKTTTEVFKDPNHYGGPQKRPFIQMIQRKVYVEITNPDHFDHS